MISCNGYNEFFMNNVHVIIAFTKTWSEPNQKHVFMLYFTIQCLRSFSLRHLFADIDECRSNACTNGATCSDAVYSYNCGCVAGYTGTHCETGSSFKVPISHYTLFCCRNQLVESLFPHDRKIDCSEPIGWKNHDLRRVFCKTTNNILLLPPNVE